MANFKYSQNKIFAVEISTKEFPDNDLYLYIHNNYIKVAEATNPFIFEYLKLIRETPRYKKLKDYTKFGNTIDFKFLDNDCLLLSEGIITQDLSKPDYKTAKLRVLEDKTRLFGFHDAQNIQIAKDIASKMTEDDYNKLNPNILQAYAMLPVILPKDDSTCPYHAATVIFKDETTNITLEADSGLGYLKRPIFDIYSTTIPEQSFYQRYKANYTVHDKPPACGILFSRFVAITKKESPKKSGSRSPKKSGSRSPKKSGSRSPKKSGSKSS